MCTGQNRILIIFQKKFVLISSSWGYQKPYMTLFYQENLLYSMVHQFTNLDDNNSLKVTYSSNNLHKNKIHIFFNV